MVCSLVRRNRSLSSIGQGVYAVTRSTFPRSSPKSHTRRALPRSLERLKLIRVTFCSFQWESYVFRSPWCLRRTVWSWCPSRFREFTHTRISSTLLTDSSTLPGCSYCFAVVSTSSWTCSSCLPMSLNTRSAGFSALLKSQALCLPYSRFM